MNQHFNCIMLVDDNRDDNFYHEREIKKNDPATIVITETTGCEALVYLRSRKENNAILPDLIFLDIKMPERDIFGLISRKFADGVSCRARVRDTLILRIRY